MNDFRRDRRSASREIVRISDWVKANPTCRDLAQLRTQRMYLEKAYDKYTDAHNDILELINDPSEDDEDRDIVDALLLTAMANLMGQLEDLSVRRKATPFPDPSIAQSQVKLPEVSIPPFNGDVTKWSSFNELFAALIENNNALSDIERFIYLKGYLKGEPARLIEHLEVTNRNFPLALRTLRDRYSNPNLVVHRLVRDIIDLKPLPDNSSSLPTLLREFHVAATTAVNALDHHNLTDRQRYEALLHALLERKLDYGTRRQLEFENKDLLALPTWSDFAGGIHTRCVHLENLKDAQRSKPSSVKTTFDRIPKSVHHACASRVEPLSSSQRRSPSPPVSPVSKCLYCSSQSHRLYVCGDFQGLSVSDRFNFAKTSGLCINCLGGRHSREECLSKRTCTTCHKTHHSLLHRDSNGSPPTRSGNQTSPASRDKRKGPSKSNASGSGSQTSTSSSHNTISAFCSSRSQVLLGTLKLCIYSAQGHRVTARALLDSGSQISCMTRSLADRLKFPVYKNSIFVSALNAQTFSTADTMDIVVRSRLSNERLRLSCTILDNIASNLPQFTVDVGKLPIPPGYQLADPDFGHPAPVDILLGARVYAQIVRAGFLSLGNNLPLLQDSIFGYIISGNVPNRFLKNPKPTARACETRTSAHAVVLHARITSSDPLEQLVRGFCESEEIPPARETAPQDEQVEQSFLSTTKRLADGSFQVTLPFIRPEEPSRLGFSFTMAKNRLNSLMGRLQGDKDRLIEYSKVVDEYVQLNHVSRVPVSFRNEQNLNAYFLPHFAVVKEEGTSKTRVVFDGSARTSSGLSLNDTLLNGFSVQPSLFDILLRLRSFPFVYLADIKQMYRQIHIAPEQRYLLNFLWTDDRDTVCYRHNRLVFGLRPASYLATRVLNQLADEHKDAYPLAYAALRKQTYVDDVLTGCNSENTLREIHTQLEAVLRTANFQLHKQSSNSQRFLADVASEPARDFYMHPEAGSNHILGLKWSPVDDTFSFTFPNVVTEGPVTKRGVLTLVAQCWDPLGLVSPVVLIGKILVQRVWALSVAWDDPIEDESFLLDWTSFLRSFSAAARYNVPRNLFPSADPTEVELHIFCDASSSAFAAVAYCRALYPNQSVSVRLLTSKTRVAPSKSRLTIPRLELSAMKLGTQLVESLINTYKDSVVFHHVHLWTDSEIALYWAKAPPTRWSTFVANRVESIQRLTHAHSWHHVPSADNAADLASRGCSPLGLVNSPSWLYGPPFLREARVDYSRFKLHFSPEEVPEAKTPVLALYCSQASGFWPDLFAKFSSYSRLRRVVAYVLRFPSSTRRPSNAVASERRGLSLTPRELQNAERTVVRVLQRQYFPAVYSALCSGNANPDRRLLSLNLFYDPQDQCIRVGGRLQNADLPYDNRNPILLPARDRVVSMMLEEQHIALGHAGPQSTLSNFRLRFWPLNALREVKRIIHRCLICYRFRATGSQQIMASLPADRISQSRPFSRVSIDYGGYYTVKASKLRKAPLLKVYIAIFVCMATKAVHIELVSSLSTEDFIMTLKRFIARRGNPVLIRSDNATNFCGAKNALWELKKFLSSSTLSDDIRAYCAKNFITFEFIPPRGPHFGGLHESAIKSCKYHLRRVVGQQCLTFEQFSTVLAQIEAVLNSRPLFPMSNDPTDLECLTPGHFLIGAPLTAYPERNALDIPEGRLSLYQRISHIQQQFWRRWRLDYLSQLQQRRKWREVLPDLAAGTMVLLREDDVPPLNWPLGRIIETYPGPDGRVRTVKVKTASGVYIRPIVKVSPLPLSESAPDSEAKPTAV